MHSHISTKSRSRRNVTITVLVDEIFKHYLTVSDVVLEKTESICSRQIPKSVCSIPFLLNRGHTLFLKKIQKAYRVYPHILSPTSFLTAYFSHKHFITPNKEQFSLKQIVQKKHLQSKCKAMGKWLIDNIDLIAH